MEASASVELDRPIESVFAFVSNPANLDRWVAGASDTVHRSGDGVGARYAGTYRSGGRTAPMTYEVTRLEPPHEVRIAGAGPFSFRIVMTLEPTATGTLLNYAVDADADGRVTAITFALLGPVLRRLMARGYRRDLETLRAALESETTGTRRVEA